MGVVLMVAAFAAFDPVRFAITVLLISRPQPTRSLFAYWLGAVAMSVAAAVGLLTILRDLAPLYAHSVTSFAASPTGRHIQIVSGLLVLLFALLISAGFSAKRPAPILLPADDSSLLPVDGSSFLPADDSSLLPADDCSAPLLQLTAPSTMSRLMTRARGTLDGECLWLAFVAGLGSGPPPIEYVVVIAAIAASNAAIHTQVCLVLLFVIVMLAIVEISLVSCWLATPLKIQGFMLQLQNWVRSRRRGIVAVFLAVTGALLVTAGMGSA